MPLKTLHIVRNDRVIFYFYVHTPTLCRPGLMAGQDGHVAHLKKHNAHKEAHDAPSRRARFLAPGSIFLFGPM